MTARNHLWNEKLLEKLRHQLDPPQKAQIKREKAVTSEVSRDPLRRESEGGSWAWKNQWSEET